MHWKMICTMVLGFAALLAGAAVAGDDERALQQRFRERAPQLQRLKQDGKIGETWQGYVEAVEGGGGEAGSLISAENDDRRKLYQLISRQEGIAAEEVARNNAVRNFNKARKGEYLKGPDGKWKQK